MERGLKEGKTYSGEFFKEKRISITEVLLQLAGEERDVCGGRWAGEGWAKQELQLYTKHLCCFLKKKKKSLSCIYYTSSLKNVKGGLTY